MIRGILFIACAAWLTTGCHKSNDSAHAITVQVQIAPQPPKIGAATVSLNLTDAGAKPVSGARVTLEGDMAHPGMEPVFGQAEETQPGRYQGHLVLTMAGDWVVLAHIRLANGEKLEQQVEVSGVQPN